MMTEIILASSAGFCFGVNRAVELVESLLAQGKKVATLGPIIHNQQMVERLSSMGVHTLSSLAEAMPSDTIVIRSHGVPESVIKQLEARKLTFFDGTCPFVAKIHKIVNSASQKGDTILVAGDSAHPEVKGICGHCFGSVFCVANPEEVQVLIDEHPFLSLEPVTLVAQTTFSVDGYEKIKDFTKKVCTNLSFFDTICNATAVRQQEALSLASKVDKMVVIGGRSSSNTAKLVQLCSSICPTLFVETVAELDFNSLKGCKRIGVTAGASTPAFIIKEVQQTMSEVLNNIVEDDVNFEEMLEQSLKSVYNGEKVVGTVVGIAPNEIAVDIGTKHAGFIPLDELTDDPSAKVEDLVKKGDQLNLVVVRVNDMEGTVKLSKKRFDAAAGFEKIMNAVDTEEILEGVVVDVVKGGVLAVSNGVRIFIPASQSGIPRDGDLQSLLKTKVRFKILEVNKGRKRAIGSIRAVLRDEKKKLADEFWSKVAIGDVYKGEVKSITSYGVFVDLGGVDGMIHISELSWSRIKHPSEVVKVGDVLEVYIKDLDSEKKKISLGYKKSEDNPWEIFKRDYPVGTVCKVTIVSMTTFGAFARILPGIDGLIHISQISQERIAKPQDVLNIGDEVEVKITDADLEKRRISLSMKAVLEDTETDSPSEAE